MMSNVAYKILYHDTCIHIDNNHRMYSVICMIKANKHVEDAFVMSIYETRTDTCAEYRSDDYDELLGRWLELKQEL